MSYQPAPTASIDPASIDPTLMDSTLPSIPGETLGASAESGTTLPLGDFMPSLTGSKAVELKEALVANDFSTLSQYPSCRQSGSEGIQAQICQEAPDETKYVTSRDQVLLHQLAKWLVFEDPVLRRNPFDLSTKDAVESTVEYLSAKESGRRMTCTSAVLQEWASKRYNEAAPLAKDNAWRVKGRLFTRGSTTICEECFWVRAIFREAWPNEEKKTCGCKTYRARRRPAGSTAL